MKLDQQDLRWAIQRLPKNLKEVMKLPEWHNAIFVGGGYLRSIVSNEKVNDVDIFVKSKKEAELLAHKLATDKRDIYQTDNAFTVRGPVTIQIISRWVFDKLEDVSNSFDFTVCCAVIGFNGTEYESYCDNRFYIDLAAKRLVYRSPSRNEDAGGSMLRVLKYYQKGYRIPLDSLGAVIARLVKEIRPDTDIRNEEQVGWIITGLLREVDPAIDPLHNAHLPSKDDSNIPV